MNNYKSNNNIQASVRAGVAKSDITTDAGLEIHDPLYAKVLVLTDGNIN